MATAPEEMGDEGGGRVGGLGEVQDSHPTPDFAEGLAAIVLPKDPKPGKPGGAPVNPKAPPTALGGQQEKVPKDKDKGKSQAEKQKEILRRRIRQHCDPIGACYYCAQTPKEGEQRHLSRNCPDRTSGKKPYDWNKHFFSRAR